MSATSRRCARRSPRALFSQNSQKGTRIPTRGRCAHGTSTVRRARPARRSSSALWACSSGRTRLHEVVDARSGRRAAARSPPRCRPARSRASRAARARDQIICIGGTRNGSALDADEHDAPARAGQRRRHLVGRRPSRRTAATTSAPSAAGQRAHARRRCRRRSARACVGAELAARGPASPASG